MNREFFEYWQKRIKDKNKFQTIKYRDINGKYLEEKDPFFNNISKAIHKKGQISKDDLVAIYTWKTKRWSKNIDENLNNIKDISKILLSSDTSLSDKLDKLTETKGVGIPRASAVLTVIYPKKYCIVDFWAWHGLLTLLRGKYNDSEYLKALNYYKNYLSSKESYYFYLKQIKEIANDFGKTPRIIELILFTFAQNITKKINED